MVIVIGIGIKVQQHRCKKVLFIGITYASLVINIIK